MSRSDWSLDKSEKSVYRAGVEVLVKEGECGEGSMLVDTR